MPQFNARCIERLLREAEMNSPQVPERAWFNTVGNYVPHCHNLEHEDDGMMLNFNIV
jgi:hypothetical protein